MNGMEITLVRCKTCGMVQMPPRWVCSSCGEEDLAQIPGGESGTVYSFTTIHVAPARFREQVPYHVALVELPHGIKVTARVECEAGQELKIGTPLSLSGVDQGCLWFKAVEPERTKAGA